MPSTGWAIPAVLLWRTDYFNTTERAVSSNYIVGLQGEVICCIPDEEVSWCTNQANSYTKGTKITLSNATLYASSTAKSGDTTGEFLRYRRFFRFACQFFAFCAAKLQL